MGILDSDTVIVDAILTKLGRDKLRQGQPLGITQYAFGDTGVDYTLFNADHPSGSDSYGSAITSLPQLEAVPDDDVFLRSKLYGTGERGIQSTAIELRPKVFTAGTEVSATNFRFTVLDMRGLTAIAGGQTITGDAFNSADVNKRSATGLILSLNAQAGQIEREVTRTVIVELAEGGAAPVSATITVQTNIDVTTGGSGS